VAQGHHRVRMKVELPGTDLSVTSNAVDVTLRCSSTNRPAGTQ
jgi:hypothetical protein